MEKPGCVISVVVVIGISIILGQCRNCSTKKMAVQHEKSRVAQTLLEEKKDKAFNDELLAFLAEYDPPLSSKRGETVRAISDNQAIRVKLLAKIDKYPSEEAKAVFRTKVARYDDVISKLNHLLTAIDKSATVAMAQREARIDEGGGIGSMDSQPLIDSAENILKQAAALQRDSESLSSATTTANSGTLLRDNNPPPKGSITDAVLTNADQFGKAIVNGAPVAEDPQLESASERGKEIIKANQKAAAVLESIKKDKAAQAAAPKTPPTRKANPANPKPASTAAERESIKKEIRRLDAAIATNEANLNQAWARINQITQHGTVPIIKGSRQHIDYLAAHRVLEDCDAQLPDMKNRRDQLKEQLEKR